MARMTELAAFLKAHDDYMVVSHLNPDGDAAGSVIAMTLALRAMGKRAFAYLPGGCPKMFADFRYSDEPFGGEEIPFEPRTSLVLDISEYSRMDTATRFYDRCEAHAVLDHHGTNPGFGEVCVIDGSAASCGELAVELIRELGVTLTVDMATWLYIAICTDCGRFSFSSTSRDTMQAAAECVGAGIDVDDITQKLYRTRSEGHVRLLGAVLSKMEMNPEKTICHSCVTRQDYRAAGALREDTNGIVNYLLEMPGVRIAVLAEERDDMETKVSVRAKPPLDIANGIAKPLGGGGHAQASGVTLKMRLEEALSTVLNRAEELLRN